MAEPPQRRIFHEEWSGVSGGVSAYQCSCSSHDLLLDHFCPYRTRPSYRCNLVRAVMNPVYVNIPYVLYVHPFLTQTKVGQYRMYVHKLVKTVCKYIFCVAYFRMCCRAEKCRYDADSAGILLSLCQSHDFFYDCWREYPASLTEQIRDLW